MVVRHADNIPSYKVPLSQLELSLLYTALDNHKRTLHQIAAKITHRDRRDNEEQCVLIESAVKNCTELHQRLSDLLRRRDLRRRAAS